MSTRQSTQWIALRVQWEQKMSDLVQRLRDRSAHMYGDEFRVCREAADEIERLRALLQDVSKLLKDAPPVCDNIYSRGDQSYGAQVRAMRARIDAELAKGEQ